MGGETPSSSLRSIQRHLSGANFSLSTLGDTRDNELYNGNEDDYLSQNSLSLKSNFGGDESDDFRTDLEHDFYYDSQYSNYYSTDKLANSTNSTHTNTRNSTSMQKCSKNRCDLESFAFFNVVLVAEHKQSR